METIEVKPLSVRAQIKIPEPVHTGKETLLIEQANLGYGERIVLNNVNLRLERGSRLGIVGFNGVGKSTLLKSLGQRIPLLAGNIKLGYQVSLSYFAQHVTEDLQLEDTVLDSLQKAAHLEIKSQEILNMAGSLLFSGDDIFKKIKVLSGGEKTRVALGQMLLKKSPLLIMDEPTNHLDFDTVEALTLALSEFTGTLVVVSHDRSFIGRVANKILEINNGRVEFYPGTYDDYVWSLEKGALKEREVAPIVNSEKSIGKDVITAPKFNYKEQSKLLQSEIKEFERKILKCEEILFSLSKKRDELLQTLISAQGADAREASKNLSQCSQEIETTEENLLMHMENLDIKEKALKELKGL